MTSLKNWIWFKADSYWYRRQLPDVSLAWKFQYETTQTLHRFRRGQILNIFARAPDKNAAQKLMRLWSGSLWAKWSKHDELVECINTDVNAHPHSCVGFDSSVVIIPFEESGRTLRLCPRQKSLVSDWLRSAVLRFSLNKKYSSLIMFFTFTQNESE